MHSPVDSHPMAPLCPPPPPLAPPTTLRTPLLSPPPSRPPAKHTSAHMLVRQHQIDNMRCFIHPQTLPCPPPQPPSLRPSIHTYYPPPPPHPHPTPTPLGPSCKACTRLPAFGKHQYDTAAAAYIAPNTCGPPTRWHLLTQKHSTPAPSFALLRPPSPPPPCGCLPACWRTPG